jgi:hypothetical protein
LGAKYGRRILGISALAMTHLACAGRFADDPNPGCDGEAFRSAGGSSAGTWPLRFDCGTEDPLVEANRRLHSDLTAHGVRHRYQEFPGYHS